jgi:hypothetical protein
MRISATQIESFRLFLSGEWMSTEEFHAGLTGTFTPTRAVALGTAFGKVLETPDAYKAPHGYRITAYGETFEFGDDVMAEPLSLVDRRGTFEAKAVKRYGSHEVASKADHLYGAELSEFKTTLSSFDFDKYAQSVQWRFMCHAFEPRRITYRVFLLSEATNGVISLRSCESFHLYPYAGLGADCGEMVHEFASYVRAVGLQGVFDARQSASLA